MSNWCLTTELLDIIEISATNIEGHLETQREKLVILVKHKKCLFCGRKIREVGAALT